MKIETLGVIFLFGLFVIGSACAALVTYQALHGPGAYNFYQGWRP